MTSGREFAFGRPALLEISIDILLASLPLPPLSLHELSDEA
jgi:hypothetical protein